MLVSLSRLSHIPANVKPCQSRCQTRGFTPISYFGLLRPAQQFGPVMRSRGADGQSSAVPWVNLLSIFALSLARACVATLKDDVEDVYPGDVAQDGLTRFKESRKVMEGELATG